MEGVNLKTVQELMGHKTIAMTSRYAHLAPGYLETELETLVQRHHRETEKAERTRYRLVPIWSRCFHAPFRFLSSS